MTLGVPCSVSAVKSVMFSLHPGAQHTFETNSLLFRKSLIPLLPHLRAPPDFRASCLSLSCCLTLGIFLKHFVLSTSLKWGRFSLPHCIP